MEILNWISVAIGVMGVAVILWGLLTGMVEFITLEYSRFKRRNICSQREHLRHHIGSYLLLGLEILIAADIIHTVLEPTLNSLAILGSIVAIRTVLNYFLNRELSNFHQCRSD